MGRVMAASGLERRYHKQENVLSVGVCDEFIKEMSKIDFNIRQ